MDRVQTLKDIPPPNDAPKVLSFLGFIGVFRHWIPNFASLAHPLYQAAKETPTGPLTSPSMVRRCFSSLRDTLLQAPALALPKPSKPYHLFTDKPSGIPKGSLPNYQALFTDQSLTSPGSWIPLSGTGSHDSELLRGWPPSPGRLLSYPNYNQ
jgi:hypothetical protein